MAKAKRKPLPKFNTPVGIARYPHLNKPDTRFDDDGVYKCDLIIARDDDGVEELITYLEELRDKRFKKAKKEKKKDVSAVEKADVYAVDVDDAGDETGKVIFKTKLNAIGRSGDETWKNEPKVFDSQGNPLASDVQVWSGSKLIIAGTVNVYAMTNEVRVDGEKQKIVSVGVSLKCRGVQVIELVSGGGQTAESFGFGSQAGGYVGEAAKAGLGDTDEDAGDSDDDGDEDEF